MERPILATGMTSGSSAKQRYKLSLGTVVEVMQSEVAITSAQTRLSKAPYDYKIAEVTLAYSARGRSELEMEATAREQSSKKLLWHIRKPLPEDAQKGRPARPQRAKRRGVRSCTLSL